MNISDIAAFQFSLSIMQNGQKSSIQSVERTTGFTVQNVAKAIGTDASTQAQVIIQGIMYIADQVREYMDSDPPFFPVGHPQRPDMIKRIKDIGDAIQKSSIDPSLKNLASSSNLSAHSTDEKISTALDKLHKVKDALTQENMQSKEPAKPGAILNLKV